MFNTFGLFVNKTIVSEEFISVGKCWLFRACGAMTTIFFDPVCLGSCWIETIHTLKEAVTLSFEDLVQRFDTAQFLHDLFDRCCWLVFRWASSILVIVFVLWEGRGRYCRCWITVWFLLSDIWFVVEFAVFLFCTEIKVTA